MASEVPLPSSMDEETMAEWLRVLLLMLGKRAFKRTARAVLTLCETKTREAAFGVAALANLRPGVVITESECESVITRVMKKETPHG